MKISELIVKLQEVQLQHGNLKCRTYDSEFIYLYQNVNDVEVSKEDNIDIVVIC